IIRRPGIEQSGRSFLGWQLRGGLAGWDPLLVGDGQRQETARDPDRSERAAPAGLLGLCRGHAHSQYLRSDHGRSGRGYGERRRGGGPVVPDQDALVSPGWKYLAYLTRPADHRLIHIRDLATGKELVQIDAGLYGGTQILCFSADDKTLFWDHNPARGIVA